MVEIRITKEIGNYEPRFVGPFTIRQTICLGVAVPACYFIYKWLTPIVTSDIAGFFCFFPGAAAALMGWVKPYGMHTEKFIRSVFVNQLLAPSHRAYKIENQHEQAEQKQQEANDAEKKAELERKYKGHPIRKRKEMPKQVKYKRSPEAIL